MYSQSTCVRQFIQVHGFSDIYNLHFPFEFCIGSLGRIVVNSSYDSDKIKTANMLLKDTKGQVIQTLPLTVCGGTFVTDVFNFPSGKYKFEIDGVDANGVLFQYTKNENVLFKKNPDLYETTPETSPVDVESGKDFSVFYTVRIIALVSV